MPYDPARRSSPSRRSGSHAGPSQDLQRSELVGMPGFEPGASCSQISSSRSPDVASCRPACRSPGVILAGRRPASPDDCARWLPLWLPPVPPRSSLLPVEQKIEFGGEIKVLRFQATEPMKIADALDSWRTDTNHDFAAIRCTCHALRSGRHSPVRRVTLGEAAARICQLMTR
jgi:hypothetical protein